MGDRFTYRGTYPPRHRPGAPFVSQQTPNVGVATNSDGGEPDIGTARA
jgi:hypothetical protein